MLVGVQLPETSHLENEASLDELTRLVTTLGHKVVGRMSQKRTSQRAAAVLGEGALKTLALRTGGTGVVGSMVDRKLSKAALKFEKNQVEETEDEVEDEIDQDEQELEPASEPTGERADTVIFDCDLSPSQLRR